MANSECFRDFCLTCDRESPDGPYCSQTCRLLDLEKGDSPHTARQSYIQPPSSRQNKYHPPPSHQQHQTASTRRTSTSYDTAPNAFSNRLFPTTQRSNQSYMPAQQQQRPPSSPQSFQSNGEPLTPSSSHDSLTTSNSHSGSRQADPNAISQEAQLELLEYYRSFDQTRARKRRQSLY